MTQTTENPLVSVNVITYNSAQTIIETLESIKDQTYPNIELIISDDCSKDNTIDICAKWLQSNKSRFTNSKIVTSPVNTGLAPNYNRAINAASGIWIKEIDGDDKLLPNCVSDFIEYSRNNPDAKYIFAKVRCFGADEATCKRYEDVFKYEMFNKTQEEQLHQMVYVDNYIPCQGSFYNKAFIDELRFRNDERMPMIGDWPKWITLLQKGVKFYFMDKYVADYRIGNGVSTSSNVSPIYKRSLLLTDIYYRWPIWMGDGTQESMDRIAKQVVGAEDEIIRLRNTHAYRLGKMLLKPISWLQKIAR